MTQNDLIRNDFIGCTIMTSEMVRSFPRWPSSACGWPPYKWANPLCSYHRTSVSTIRSGLSGSDRSVSGKGGFTLKPGGRNEPPDIPPPNTSRRVVPGERTNPVGSRRSPILAVGGLTTCFEQLLMKETISYQEPYYVRPKSKNY